MAGKIFYAGLLTVMIMLISTPAFAKHDLTPAISIKEEYNDNIFLANWGAEDDFITTVSPSITYDYTSGKALDLSLFYGLNFRFYDRHSNLNIEEVTDAQEIVFEAHLTPLNYLFVDISDNYQNVPIDVRRSVAIDNANENMTNKNEFFVSPYVVLPLTTSFSVTGGYGYENVWFKDDEAFDYENHSAFITMDKRFSKRINGALNYRYTAHRPDAGDQQEVEYDRHEASVAIDYLITRDVRVNGEVGEAWFDYKNGVDDEERLFWNIGFDNVFRLNEYTSLDLDYGISFGDSSSSGAVKTHEFGLSFKTGKTLTLEINPYVRNVKYLTMERKDRIVGVASELSRPVSRQIRVSLTGKWERKKFLPEDESTANYSLGSGIYYALSRSMMMSVGYRYSRQDASSDVDVTGIEINNYDNNIAWIQARITF